MSFLSFSFFLENIGKLCCLGKNSKGCLAELELTKLGNSERAVSGAASLTTKEILKRAIDRTESGRGRKMMKPIKFDHWAEVVSVSFLFKVTVSLHSGAFASPADCVLRTIRLECREEKCMLPAPNFLKSLSQWPIWVGFWIPGLQRLSYLEYTINQDHST